MRYYCTLSILMLLREAIGKRKGWGVQAGPTGWLGKLDHGCDHSISVKD